MMGAAAAAGGMSAGASAGAASPSSSRGMDPASSGTGSANGPSSEDQHRLKRATSATAREYAWRRTAYTRTARSRCCETMAFLA
eukprot:3782091-Prymnesium_polylepis.2